MDIFIAFHGHYGQDSMSHLMDGCDALLKVPHAYALRILVYTKSACERVCMREESG